MLSQQIMNQFSPSGNAGGASSSQQNQFRDSVNFGRGGMQAQSPTPPGNSDNI